MRKDTSAPLPTRLASLAAFCAASIGVLAVGGWLTTAGRGDGWYASLEKPPFQPPDWAFGPVWISLMLLTAIATWRIYERRTSTRPAWRIAFSLYVLQLILNVGWSALFFYLHRPTAALVEIVVLDIVMAAMIATYARIDRIAAWLLVPYLLWLCLATALNGWIVANN